MKNRHLFSKNIILIFLLSLSVRAEYWGGVGQIKQADMAMQDMALPYFAETTYNAFWHSWFRSKTQPEKAMFFYGGNTFNNQGKADYANSTYMQWSFWGHGHQVDPIYALPGFKLTNEVGEGANAKSAGFYPLSEKRWYRHLVRFWSPSDKEQAKTHSYIGWWMKDLEGDNRWTLLGVAKVALAEACFTGTGLGGFIEDFGYGGRKSHGQSFRNLYTHADGQWESCKFQATAKKNEYAKVTHSVDKTSVDFEISAKPFPGATIRTENETVALKQAPQPIFGQIEFDKIGAMKEGNELLVSWGFQKDSTPQLRSKIEVFNSAEATEAVFTYHSDLPSVHEAFIHLPAKITDSAHSVKITTTDVFNQTVTKTAVLHKKTNRELEAQTLDSPKQGVKISYYEKENALKRIPREDRSFANWSTQPDLAKLSLSRTVYQKNLNLNVMPRKYGVAAKASSYLKINQAGLYRFHLKATDGGSLKINGKMLIDQNIYGSADPKTTWIVLRKGYYPLEMLAYIDTIEAMKNKPALTLEYEGPNLQRQQVPATAWFLPGENYLLPKVVFTAKAGSGKAANLVSLNLAEDPSDNRELEKIEIISQSGETWATFTPNLTVQLRSILMPQGKHQLFPRLFYKDKDVFDLPAKEVSVKSGKILGWQLCSEGNQRPQRPLGYVVEENNITLMGDGTRWMTKKVTGDFKFSMRVKSLQNAVGRNLHTPKVQFGLFVSENFKRPANKTFNWMYDPYFKARFETPKRNFHGLKQEHWKNSYHKFIVGSYFKISRQGNLFVGAVKAALDDPWTVIFEEEAALSQALYVGPYLYQVPTPNREMFYRVEFDQVQINK